MSLPLKKAAWLASLIAPLVLMGCGSTQLTQTAPEAQLSSHLANLQADKPVLYPAHFSLRLQTGLSGALLPENLDASLQPLLDQVASWQQVSRIVVVGHTDGEGSEKSNLLLSLRRANAVADKLADFGVPMGVLEVDGRGESVPIADNNSISGRKLNRRIEIVANGWVDGQQKKLLSQR
ncbi:OmpA family protein [Porticoccus sp. W117]|uniref:OmpA family protein n=1 Tax=Porticoccus sp. W117 TaxID=3054777 RepID=UPI002593E324|nr:OmpA family protein [Porticoccus sp. W117]MDM3869744.1 OmpA family protein [Porticoccus sp. W117]